MLIRLEADQFRNLRVIYSLGSNAVEVVTANSRTIRITARRTLRGPVSEYWGSYDELVDLPIGEATVAVWTKASFPWSSGETVEQCLRSAMHFVDEVGSAPR